MPWKVVICLSLTVAGVSKNDATKVGFGVSHRKRIAEENSGQPSVVVVEKMQYRKGVATGVSMGVWRKKSHKKRTTVEDRTRQPSTVHMQRPERRLYLRVETQAEMATTCIRGTVKRESWGKS